jgi:hypothetical protein
MSERPAPGACKAEVVFCKSCVTISKLVLVFVSLIHHPKNIAMVTLDSEREEHADLIQQCFSRLDHLSDADCCSTSISLAITLHPSRPLAYSFQSLEVANNHERLQVARAKVNHHSPIEHSSTKHLALKSRPGAQQMGLYPSSKVQSEFRLNRSVYSSLSRYNIHGSKALCAVINRSLAGLVVPEYVSI